MKKRNKMVESLLAAVLAVAMLTLTACGGSVQDGSPESSNTAKQSDTATAHSTDESSDGTSTAATSKDEMVIIFNGDHGNVNMAVSVGNNASALTSMCTNYLVDNYYLEDGSYEVGICDRSLAESYEWDDDYLGITFNLRQGVKFQNGEELTAEDVVMSIGFFTVKGGMEFIDFDNVKAVDDYTVYVPFTGVHKSALTQIGLIGIWNKDYYDQVNGDENIFFHDAPIGTGAFQITEYRTDDFVTLERFEDYFEGAAILSKITARFISDTSVAFSELETGNADYIFVPGGTDAANVLAGSYPNLACSETPLEDALCIGFNGYSKKLQDLRVRQALCYAFDRESMVAVYDGMGEDIYTIMSNKPNTMTDFSSNWFYEYDLEKAVSLLDEAGITDTDGDGLREDADGKDFSITYLYIGTNNIYATIGEIMKNSLASIGVTIELGGYDVSTYDDMMRNDVESWDIFEMGLGSIASSNGWNYTPQTQMITYAHADQFDSWESYVNTYIEPLNTTMENDAWWEKFREFENAALTDYLYWYPIVQRMDKSVYSSSLKGLERIGWQTWNLTNVYFE